MKCLKINISLLFIFFLVTFSGCQKTPINGNLDGEWEVIEVSPQPPELEDETRFFYNFSRHVCQLTVYGGPFTLGNMTYEDNRIFLDFPYIHSESDMLILNQYGIFSNPVEFKVEFQGKSRMILTNSESTVVLKKF